MTKTETIIPEKIFFKIGEVCGLVGVQAHVLRYWETEFPTLSPQKNRSGQRTYRRRDVEIALRIKELLYEELYTIAGAKKRLQSGSRKTNRSKIEKKEKISKSDMKPDDQQNSMDVGNNASDRHPKLSRLELDDSRRDALKSLITQLLELRELLKNDKATQTQVFIDNSKRF